MAKRTKPIWVTKVYADGGKAFVVFNPDFVAAKELKTLPALMISEAYLPMAVFQEWFPSVQLVAYHSRLLRLRGKAQVLNG